MESHCTLSISILHNKQLWGLISCHHREPRNIDLNALMNLYLLANDISAFIEQKEFKKQENTLALAKKGIGEIQDIAALKESPDIEDLMASVNADGMGVLLGNEYSSVKHAPPKQELLKVIEKVKPSILEKGFWACDELGKYNDYFKDLSIKGLLVIMLTDSINHCLIFFRNALSKPIRWAGQQTDIEKTLLPEEKLLTPRHSFEAWEELIKDKSQSWESSELSIAEYMYKQQFQIFNPLIIKKNS